jgi:hypothetical protein
LPALVFSSASPCTAAKAVLTPTSEACSEVSRKAALPAASVPTSVMRASAMPPSSITVSSTSTTTIVTPLLRLHHVS